MSKTIRIVIIGVAVVAALAAAVGAYVWRELKLKPVVTQSEWLYIEGGQLSKPELMEGRNIQWALQLNQNYTKRLAAGELDGAYKLTEGMAALQLVRKLARHQQDPVRITFRDVRSLDQLAGRLAQQLMADSASIRDAMTEAQLLDKAQLDRNNILSIFLPDTYEVYWDIAPEALMARMLKEYERFWNDHRREQAQAMGLEPREVSVLASIAEEETANRHERGVVGRLYWNRLQKGMLLQADPTVKFAMGDFGLKRILLRHLEVESPYNTYRHEGLPPGPIRIVEKATIDSILTSREHGYLYMCAKPELNGLHNFAVTLSEHNRNAEAYHAAINRLKN